MEVSGDSVFVLKQKLHSLYIQPHLQDKQTSVLPAGLLTLLLNAASFQLEGSGMKW